jgi:hypothetical protein
MRSGLQIYKPFTFMFQTHDVTVIILHEMAFTLFRQLYLILIITAYEINIISYRCICCFLKEIYSVGAILS